jgi:hypothetical protein
MGGGAASRRGGIVHQITVTWGTGAPAWTYTVAYSHLGTTPAPVAPAYEPLCGTGCAPASLAAAGSTPTVHHSLPWSLGRADNGRMRDRSSHPLVRHAAEVERLDAARARAAGGQPTMARTSDLRR